MLQQLIHRRQLPVADAQQADLVVQGGASGRRHIQKADRPGAVLVERDLQAALSGFAGFGLQWRLLLQLIGQQEVASTSCKAISTAWR